jgi:hypothetical protein
MAGLLGISLVSVFFLDPVRVECELSFRCAFQRFHPLVAIIYVLFSVLTYAAVLGIIVMVCTILWLWLVEQFELRLLALSANARPKSVPAAMEKLTTLRFESSKAEYVRTLHRWLPICADWEILLEEAENERGAVCDELYRLAEFWQDNTI